MTCRNDALPIQIPELLIGHHLQIGHLGALPYLEKENLTLTCKHPRLSSILEPIRKTNEAIQELCGSINNHPLHTNAVDANYDVMIAYGVAPAVFELALRRMNKQHYI